jgi:ankyrin repeat protein
MFKNLLFTIILFVFVVVISCANDVDELYKAVEKADVSKVKELIDKGIKLDIEGKDKQPLHITVEKGNKELVEVLLKGGANINSKTKEGDTPLHIAYYKENWDLFRYLVENGSDVNIKVSGEIESELSKKKYKYNAFLHFALIPDHIDLLKLIIENGLRLNQKGDSGGNILHNAISYSNIKELLKYLVSKGADLSIRNNEGRTPFDEALWERKMDNAETLLELGAWKYEDGRVFHYLEQLCEKGYKDDALRITKTILINKKDIDLNYQTKDGGYTALHYAAMFNQDDFVELLLKYGGNPNIKSATGLLPIDVTEVLLKSPQFKVEDPATWKKKAERIKNLLLGSGSQPYRGFKFMTIIKGDSAVEDIVAIDYKE